MTWKKGDEPYYPVNDEKNTALYAKYKELAENYDFEIVDSGINTVADVEMAAKDLASKVDCISNLTDNTVVYLHCRP